MYKWGKMIFLNILMLAASLLWGVPCGNAQAQDTVQLQDPAPAAQCDGTGRSGSTQGLRHSTSNCDREAAAARTAARIAAGASGKTEPAKPNPEISTPDVSAPEAPASDTTVPDTSVIDENGGSNE